MKTIKYALLCLVPFLLWNGIVKGQSDSTKYKKFQVSVSYHRDYILRQYNIVGATHYDPIYGYDVYAFYNLYDNYSFEGNFKYYPKKFFYVKMGLLYRTQLGNAGGREFKINGIRQYTIDNLTLLRYIEIPSSFGFSFFNKSNVRPYIELSLNNAFLFRERVNSTFLINDSSGYHHEEHILVDNKLKYYNIKGAVSVGCEFYFQRNYVLGVDVNIRFLPFSQTQNLVINTLKYSNFGFGLSFGYAIK